ncbi:MAG: hypothetical protein SWE60_22125, partial [Thermodesulfobacteriota bacterium]|nr:hypothetical protein [Thermodesulfobacteriota bacterium]
MGSVGGDKALRIGVVGGGIRCKTILQMLQGQMSVQSNAAVTIVADEDPEAPGYRYAKEQGIETTTNIEAIGDRRDLDFILDLAGCRDALVPLLVRKGSKVP